MATEIAGFKHHSANHQPENRGEDKRISKATQRVAVIVVLMRESFFGLRMAIMQCVQSFAPVWL